MTTGNSLNFESLPDARRRYRRLNGCFWSSVILIPMGVVLPCILSMIAYRIWGDRVSAPIGLSALLWPIVGVAGTLLFRGGRGRAKRSLAIAEVADSLGLKFTYRPPLERYEFLGMVSFMSDPHAKSAVNLVESPPGRPGFLALDYTYSYHWGGVTEVGEQTMVVFPSGLERVPSFGVFPTSVMGRIENFFLGKGAAIPFPQVPEFNRYFTVVGDDAAAVTARFSRELVELLLSDRLLTVIVDAGRLLVFRRLTFVAAADYQGLLGQAHRVAALLTATR